MPKQTIVDVNNLSKVFENNTGVKNLNFKIKEGEILGFLGPSGSGKTTTINLLTGQLSPDSGYSTIFGHDSQKLKESDYHDIGIVGDQVGHYELMTLGENIELYAKLYQVEKGQIDHILDQVGLLDAKNKQANQLSTGMKQRMLLARALINQPKLLFLDEPTSGLDPNTSRKIHSLIQDLKDNGTTIFLTTHDMTEATKLCDHVILINAGQVVEEGSPFELMRKYQKERQAKVEKMDGNVDLVDFTDLASYLEANEVFSIHSTEPSLEDIFIELTGVNLND